MNTPSPLTDIYSQHNARRRGEYFITMEKERGPFLRGIVGTNKKVLDIGCRDGALTKYFASGNEVTGLDIDMDALERAKNIIHITTHKIDLNGPWGLQPLKFDVVVAAEVLEHVYYPDVVMKKAAEVLIDNGMFVGSVPYAYSFQSKLRFLFGIKKHTPLQDPTHINHFTYKEFCLLLNSNFKDVKIIPIISNKLRFFSFFLPFSFAHMFMFIAKGPRRNI